MVIVSECSLVLHSQLPLSITERFLTSFHKGRSKAIHREYKNENSLYICMKAKMLAHINDFNIRLNNHWKDVWKPDAIPTSCHFSDKNHNSNTHAKFILIEQIRHVDIDTEKIKERLKQRENFWNLTLETLTPKFLNQELN